MFDDVRLWLRFRRGLGSFLREPVSAAEALQTLRDTVTSASGRF